ncbi:hypothetical protein DER45DRAFT_551491 [Fusarium avenaceum]|nr:hypothetical protein DER45DRAFT_551491 [Fusarium avenaceum]
MESCKHSNTSPKTVFNSLFTPATLEPGPRERISSLRKSPRQSGLPGFRAGYTQHRGLGDEPRRRRYLHPDHEGGVILPKGISSLHYVVQTTIDYNKDRTGCEQEMQIEGTFVHRSRALAAANKLLDPLDYVDYETPEKMAGEWPFGEEVVAHAVAETGQNITVAVTTVSDSHLSQKDKCHGR